MLFDQVEHRGGACFLSTHAQEVGQSHLPRDPFITDGVSAVTRQNAFIIGTTNSCYPPIWSGALNISATRPLTAPGVTGTETIGAVRPDVAGWIRGTRLGAVPLQSGLLGGRGGALMIGEPYPFGPVHRTR